MVDTVGPTGPGLDRSGFATEFAAFVQAMNAEAVPPVSPLRELITGHLGADPAALAVVAEEVPNYDQPNLQLAFDAWPADGVQGQRNVVVAGVATGGGGRILGLDLADLAMGQSPPGWGVSAGPARFGEVALPDGTKLLSFESALLLVTDGDRRLVALLAPAAHRSPAQPPVSLQVMSAQRDDAVGFLADLKELRQRLNVYRGKVLAVAQGDRHDPFGDSLSLVLVDPPTHGREDVVLPPGLLETVERHTIGFAEHVDALAAAGRALHRGVLLYGPPGTGKTHVVRYLAAALEGRTTFVVSGAAFGVLGPICRLARELAPAMIVLEDVDLVAAERTMPGGHGLLFSLMNEMDGIGPDADIIFLLTTNRADVLEPALAARPGRIDLAVEVPLPDAECRRRLVELYGRGLSLAGVDVGSVVDRTEGVSASFIKELLRRAALIALTERPAGGAAVGPADMDAALAEMLDTGGALTRVLLGAQPAQAVGGGGFPGPPWMVGPAAMPPSPGPPSPGAVSRGQRAARPSSDPDAGPGDT